MYAQFQAHAGMNAAQDAETLHYAMLGSGCDEKKIVFLGSRNPVELAMIQQAFVQKFGKDLISELNKELKGHFKVVVTNLFKDPLTFDVDSLHTAMKGAGSDGDALIEILVTKSNAQKQLLKNAYQAKYGESLEGRISKETTGNFKDFLLNLLIAREENPAVVDNNAREDAVALYNAGEGKVGTDEKKFIHILSRCSFPHIAAIANHYVSSSKKHHTLAQAIESEFSGHLRTGLLAIVNIAQWGLVDYFAELAMKAMKGMGTNDEKLIRVTLLNRGPQMAVFKDHFRKKFNKPFKEWVHSETSGTYRDVMLLIIGDT
jgi:hypothetical protein